MKEALPEKNLTVGCAYKFPKGRLFSQKKNMNTYH